MPTSYKSNRPQVLQAIDQTLADTVRELGNEVIDSVQAAYFGPKTGRIYRVGKTPTKADRRAGRKSRGHRASAPGEAPALDTRNLSKGTVATEPQRVAPNRWAVICGITIQSGRADIARWLEFGTRRILPRPAWRPALELLRARRPNLEKK